jgi:TP901 family phage tail tape measure protein
MAIKIPILTSFDPKGMKQANAAFAGLQGSVRSLGKNFAIAGAAIGGFAAVSIKAFADFDASLTKSTAIMGDMSNEMRQQMSTVARDVAKATTFSAEQTAEAYYFLASAGLDAAASVAALPQVAKFAQAGMFDMALATDLATDAQSALGLSSKDANTNLSNLTRITDVFVKGATLANTSVEQLAVAITTKAGTALKTLGKDVEEGAAALAVFADQGVKGELAGTQLTNTIFGLSDRARAAPDAFKRLGISIFDTNGQMKNFADIADSVANAFKGMTTEQKLAELGNLGFSKQARAGVLLLAGNGEKIREYEAALRDATGFTEQVAGKQLKTLNAQLSLLQSEFIDVGISIGEQLEPAVRDLVAEVKELLPALGQDLVAAVKAVNWKELLTAVADFTRFLVYNIETIGKVVAAIFILNTAFKLMAVASGIAKVAIALQTWFTAQLAAGMTVATVAAGILNVAMRLIPFVAVASAIALVVVGVMELGDETKRNKPYVDNYGGAIRKTGHDAEWAASRYAVATDAVNTYNAAVSGEKITTSAAYDAFEVRRAQAMVARSVPTPAAPVFPKMPDLSSLIGSAGAGSALSMPSLDTSALDKQEKALVKLLNSSNTKKAEAARKELEILDARKKAYESFTDSVKNLFGQIKDSILSSFNLPTLGNSVNSITRNISKLLERTKGFANSISRLSGMGLNSALLQQVIQAGPMQGSKLASALVGGGAGFISQLNRAYGEFGDLAGGIAGTGTGAAFGGQQTINNFSIEVTGGLATGSDVGRAVVNAIKDYERQSGAAWRA